MKTVTILFLLLFLTTPVCSELTKEDIRTIIKEENAASEKRTREYIDLKIEAINARIDALDQKIDDVEKNLTTRIDGIDKNFDRVWLVVVGLIGLITAAIAIPQLTIAYKERGQKEMQLQIDQLRKQIEAMQTPPS